MSEFKDTPLITFEKRKMQQTKESRYWKRFENEYKSKHEEICNFIKINNKRKLFCIGVHTSVMFYSFKEKKIIYDYKKEKEPIRGFAIRKDGLLAAFSNESGYAKILNLKHKNILKYFKLSEKPIYGIDIADSKPLLAIGDDEGNFKIHEYASDMPVMNIDMLHNDFLRKIKFFPNSYEKIMTGSLDKTLKIIDIKSKSIVETLENNVEIEDFDFIDDNTVSVVGGKFLKIWDLRNTSECLKEMLIGNKTVNNVFYSNKRLITTSYDNHLKVFDTDQNFKIINQIKYDSPIIHFATDSELTRYAIGLQNKKVKIFKKGKELEKESVKKDKFSETERLLLNKLHFGVGHKDNVSYKFFNRGVWETPEDFTSKIGKPSKIKRNVCDKYLRKFQYVKALQKALSTNNTVIIISIIEELIIRDGIENAVRNLEEEFVIMLLKFILKKIDSVNTEGVLLEIFNIFLEQVEFSNLDNDVLDIIEDIENKLNAEIENSYNCKNILHMIESANHN